MKYFSLILAALILQSCIAAVPAKDFAPTAEVLGYPPNKTFAGKLNFAQAIVTDEIYGALKAEHVSSALKDALASAGYLSALDKPALYTLTATVVEIDYPAISFSMNVKAIILYEIRRIKDAKLILSERVTIGHEVSFFEGDDGNQRLRIGMAKSIAGNITHFLRLLSVNKIKV
jgi:hypothetical protein